MEIRYLRYLLNTPFKLPNRTNASYSTNRSRYNKSFVSSNSYLAWAAKVFLQDFLSYNHSHGVERKDIEDSLGKFIQCFIYLQIKRSENKTHLRIFSYLLYFRGAVRLDVGVVTRRDFRFGWRRCWSAVIFVRVCKVESKHILGVFD